MNRWQDGPGRHQGGQRQEGEEDPEKQVRCSQEYQKKTIFKYNLEGDQLKKTPCIWLRIFS